METLQQLLDSSTAPVITAFLLGLLTAISPCPLATNIAAVGFIGKDIGSKWGALRKGLLYTLGRTLGYSILGVALIGILRQGAGIFGIQKFFGRYGEMFIGPIMLVVGLFMLFGRRLNLPKFGFRPGGEDLAKKGGWGALLLGVLFALAFCPTSGVLYFGGLIPLSVASSGGYFLPVVFAIATALPVLIVAIIIAFSVESIGRFYGKMQTLQRWMNRIVGVLFVVIGIYYCIIAFL